jgi:hypothetical protein
MSNSAQSFVLHLIMSRTGKALHALGDIRLSQGSLDEAIDFFQRALVILRATIEDNHYITADTCY